MECMPLRSPPGPYHYHVTTDQTKSLQELQNEVGALLEFRDLVIETFPDLKHKMASISASNTITGLPTSSLASRRDWEPGIRVRRKLTQKEHTVDIQSSSSLIRSRSNSHSGKKEPKSGSGGGGSGGGGEGNGSVVQDSGFSTETSSSKEAHSASSTTGPTGPNTSAASATSTATNSARPNANPSSGNTASSSHQTAQTLSVAAGSTSAHHHHQHPPPAVAAAGGPFRMPNEADDELWNLLDVIHRKSMRLRDEVDRLQIQKTRQQPHPSSSSSSRTTDAPVAGDSKLSGGGVSALFQDHLDRLSREDVQILRKERDKLLEKLFQMEGEALADRIQSSRLQDDMEALQSVKRELEAQLQLALSQKLELHSRIQDMEQQDVDGSPESHKYHQPHHAQQQQNHHHQQQQHHQKRTAIDPGDMFASAAVQSISPPKQQPPSTATQSSAPSPLPSSTSTTTTTTTVHSTRQLSSSSDPATTLGRLDGVVSTPSRSTRVRVTDSKKFEAILLETNIVELQRHLLTITVQNQVLTQRLEQATKSKIFLNKKLVKAKEDIDDLRFQLEEKSIDLEGTRAQLRIVETKSTSHHHIAPARTGASRQSTQHGQHIDAATAAMLATASQVSTPSMKAMTPLAMDDPHQHHIHNHNSSSTESAQDQTELDLHAMQLQLRQLRTGAGGGVSVENETPRKRPSKIPLPGTKGYLAPKPPTGRSPTTPPTTVGGVSASASASSIRASGPPSNRSLSRSTGSLVTALNATASTTAHHHHHNHHQQHHQQHHNSRSAGPHSGTSNRRDYAAAGNSSVAASSVAAGSLHRPESALSLRKDNSSLSSSRSSSIPVSSTTASSASSSPLGAAKGAALTSAGQQQQHRLNNSPLPKPKRDTFTSRARHLDSLTRAQQHAYNYAHAQPAAATQQPPLLVYKTTSTGTSAMSSSSSSKKDLSSSFSQGQTRKSAAVAVRRVSSASVGSGRGERLETVSAGGVAGGGRTADAANGGGGSGSNDITDNGKRNERRHLEPTPSMAALRRKIADDVARATPTRRR